MAVALARFGRAGEMVFPPATIPVTLLWLWMALSLLWSPAPGPGLLVILALSGLPLGFWVYLLAPNREKMWALLGSMLLACVVAIDIFAFLQYAFAGVTRPASLFLDPNNLGGLNILAGIPVLAVLAAETLFRKERSLRRISILGVSMLVIAAAVGLSGSRSAILSAIPGLLILVACCRSFVRREGRPIDRKLLAATIGSFVLLCGVAAALGLNSDASILQRFLDLAKDPTGTAWLRMNIWEASLRLLHDVPWYGGGLGVYWLLFARVQNADDQSRGFNSHNDYLQILIEGGVPAALLLGAIIVLTCIAMVRLWRPRNEQSLAALPAAGLFAGLIALWTQCLVQSNLYLLPLSFLAGLMLARFHDVAGNRSAQVRRWRVPGIVLLPVYGGIAAASLAVLLLTALAANYFDKGYLAFVGDDMRGADEAFDRARHIAPIFDTVHIAQADMDLKRLAATPGNDVGRSALTARIGNILDEAGRFNPLRPDIYLLRGHLQMVDARTDVDSRITTAKAAYQQALALDPRFSEARVALSIILARTGDVAGAHKLLEQGMAYTYIDSPELLQYFRLTAQFRMQAGDNTGALLLAARASEIERRISRRQ
jgi:O-antigen ligase